MDEMGRRPLVCEALWWVGARPELERRGPVTLIQVPDALHTWDGDLFDVVTSEVLRRVWPQSAAVAEKEGTLTYLEYAVRKVMIWPSLDRDLSEKAIAALRAIGDEYAARGDTDGWQKIARFQHALDNAQRAFADKLERMRPEEEPDSAAEPPNTSVQ